MNCFLAYMVGLAVGIGAGVLGAVAVFLLAWRKV